MQKKIIVIGGGPAGIEAAIQAAQAGAAVTLISNSPIGGRAGWHSLLPSKVWLAAADALGLMQEAATMGVSTKTAVPAPETILKRIQDVATQWNTAQLEQLKQLGVQVKMGTGSFVNKNEVAITSNDGGEEKIGGDAIIVASGSVPIFPAQMKPDGQKVIAPRFAKALQPLPRSIAVVGGGVTGAEFAYLFNRMGVVVKWIVDQDGVLPSFVPAVGQALAAALVAQGVELIAGQMATQINDQESGVQVMLEDGQGVTAEMAFLAIGRKPDLSNLHLENLDVDSTTVISDLDEYGRLSNSNIYIIGDASGGPMVVNRALAQARVAALHAIQPAKTRPFQPQTVITATYTSPQAAQVGHVTLNDQSHTTQLAYNTTLKSRLTAEEEGFITLVYEQKENVILGAYAVGSHASDLLAPIAVAIQQQATLDDLASIYPAHPTLSELVFATARQQNTGV